jgi:hypothetical protein
MTGSKCRAGLCRGRAAVVGAIATAAVMAFGAGSAQAGTVGFHGTFDDAALNGSGLTFDVLDPPNTATMDGTIDNVTGQFGVPPSPTGFNFPDFHGEAAPGVPVTLKFTATEPISGTLNLGTGAMTTDLSGYHANIQALGGDCGYDIDLAFDTNPASPFNGDPFTVGGTGPITITSGVLETHWPANSFGSGGPGCATVDSLINGGAGGFAIAHGFDLTPAQPSGTTAPANRSAQLKKCKKKAKKIKDRAKRKKALKKCRKKFG